MVSRILSVQPSLLRVSGSVRKIVSGLTEVRLVPVDCESLDGTRKVGSSRDEGLSQDMCHSLEEGVAEVDPVVEGQE